MRLPDPQRSSAVLIGTSTYASDELAELPAVVNNVGDLATVLTDKVLGGFSAERCVQLLDIADHRNVYKTLRDQVQSVDDTILIYFAGHGLLGPNNELYLALPDTEPDLLKVSALPYELIRDLLTDCRAANRVVILDCCFSGQAIPAMSRTDHTVSGQLQIEGTYVLAATPRDAVALAPIGASNTAFTKELLRVLRVGVPGAPDPLTCREIFHALVQAAATGRLPAPRKLGTGTVELLALVRNAARVAAGRHRGRHYAEDEGSIGEPPRPAIRWWHPQQRRMLMVAAAIVAFAVLIVKVVETRGGPGGQTASPKPSVTASVMPSPSKQSTGSVKHSTAPVGDLVTGPPYGCLPPIADPKVKGVTIDSPKPGARMVKATFSGYAQLAAGEHLYFFTYSKDPRRDWCQYYLLPLREVPQGPGIAWESSEDLSGYRGNTFHGCAVIVDDAGSLAIEKAAAAPRSSPSSSVHLSRLPPHARVAHVNILVAEP